MKFFNHLDQPIVKKHILIIGSGFVLGVLFYLYFQTTAINSTSKQTLQLVLSGIVGTLVSYICYTISKQLDNLLSWKHQLTNRFLTGIIINFIAACAITIGLKFLYASIIETSFQYNRNEVINLAILLLIVMLFYNIIYFALYSYSVYAKGQINAITYERKQIDLQLKALKSQLSSHFLFNNLNTISSLAHKDIEACEKYVRGLGTIYDYSLNSYHESLVMLAEEIEVVTSYLELLKTRFGDSLQFTFAIPEGMLDSKIPPLTLQMLVENAVKHNQMDTNHVLNLNIRAHNDYIEVSNNITKPIKNITSFNIGLKTIQARYNLLNTKAIDIIKNTHFTVKVPIIQS